MTLLEVSGLTKVFRRRRRLSTEEHVVVNDVSFSIDSGTTLALVGESGAGKSTTARLVLRLIEPDAGVIRFQGTDVTKLSAAALRDHRRHTPMVFQDPYSSLDPRILVGRSVAEPLKIHGKLNRTDREQVALEMMQRVGLGAHHLARYPGELSGGQLQRVAIARALTMEPSLIVCDEAVAALDVSIRAQVLNVLRDLQDEHGLSYLFITHDLAIVEAFADFTAVMRDGSIVEQGATRELFARPGNEYTKLLIDAIPYPDPDRRSGGPELSEPTPGEPSHTRAESA